MNPSPDSDSPPPSQAVGPEPRPLDPIPGNWHEALLALLSSRISLIQLESREASLIAGKKALQTAALAICAFFTWALVLAGGIGAISKLSGWPWYGVALSAALLHLLAAIGLAMALKSKSRPTFPVTRAEFQKDREWIENLKKTRTSHD